MLGLPPSAFHSRRPLPQRDIFGQVSVNRFSFSTRTGCRALFVLMITTLDESTEHNTLALKLAATAGIGFRHPMKLI